MFKNSLKHPRVRSAGLTIAANVSIATGPALLGSPRSFVSNLFFFYMQG